MATPYLKVGLKVCSRGSPLALAQTRQVCAAVAASAGIADSGIEIVVIRTTGDQIVDRSLAEAGGKGLFTKELDEALLAGVIDCAVHSAKDLQTFLPEGIVIVGCPPREDARDVLICTKASRFADLPAGARLGSASPRRQAQALRARPDLKVGLLRGNVETRLRKIETGEFDLTLLALAGLKRLGLESRAAAILDPDDFLPAVGQGAIAITGRRDDRRLAAILAPILDDATGLALAAERAFLAELDGSCRTPIAGHARLADGRLSFRGLTLSPDGRKWAEAAREGASADAERLGAEAGREIRATAPAELLAG
jgi:hydroxymethylbilane synthase